MADLFLDPERPRMSGPTVADNVTGMYAALGILAALHQRQRTGVGGRVDVNMLEAAIAFCETLDRLESLTQELRSG